MVNSRKKLVIITTSIIFLVTSIIGLAFIIYEACFSRSNIKESNNLQAGNYAQAENDNKRLNDIKVANLETIKLNSEYKKKNDNLEGQKPLISNPKLALAIFEAINEKAYAHLNTRIKKNDINIFNESTKEAQFADLADANKILILRNEFAVNQTVFMLMNQIAFTDQFFEFIETSIDGTKYEISIRLVKLIPYLDSYRVKKYRVGFYYKRMCFISIICDKNDRICGFFVAQKTI